MTAWRSISVALVLSLGLLAGLSWPAMAGPYEDASAAYDKGDFATALRLYRPLADQGNARAQNNLGFMYAAGKGVPIDLAAAATWYRKAADQGDPQAQVNLGVMYAKGVSVPKDYVQAYMWFTLAATAGNQIGFNARRSVVNLMTADQLIEAQRLASEWRPKKR